MAQPINFTALKNSIEKSMLFLYSNDIRMFNTLDVLTRTGIRYSELCSYNWKEINDIHYMVYLPKTKTFRVIEKYKVNEAMQYYIATDDYSNLIPFHSTFSYNWQIYNLPTFSTDGQKNILSHIGRYFYIRELQNLGYSIETIKGNIGHANIEMTNKYIQKNIYLS